MPRLSGRRHAPVRGSETWSFRTTRAKSCSPPTTPRCGTSVENTATVPEATLDAMPQARLVRMESRLRNGERADMNSFFPMEIIASEKEQAELLGPSMRIRSCCFPKIAAGRSSCPTSCRKSGPWTARRRRFAARASRASTTAGRSASMPPEKTSRRLSLEYGDVTGPAGRSSSRPGHHLLQPGGHRHPWRALHQGVHARQRNGAPAVDRHDGARRRQGRAARRGAGEDQRPSATRRFASSSTVDGPMIANHGDDEPWRHSRLRWLNSTLGLDDKILPLPFTAVKRARHDDGRNPQPHLADRAARACPRRSSATASTCLASPMRIDVVWAPTGGRWPSTAAGAQGGDGEPVPRGRDDARAHAASCRRRSRSELWFDGAINYDLTLQSATPRTLQGRRRRDSDAEGTGEVLHRLLEPGRPPPERPGSGSGTAATRQRGLVRRRRGGLGLKLLGEHDYWDLSGLHWDEHRRGSTTARGARRSTKTATRWCCAPSPARRH